MPNINDAFPSNYLRASDLKGIEPVVTIERLEFEAVGPEKEMKPILYFAGKEKGMVLNKTNATMIASLSGSEDTDDWQGFAVRLYSAQVEFSGKTVNGLRVKAAGRAQPKPEPVKQIDDSDIPF